MVDPKVDEHDYVDEPLQEPGFKALKAEQAARKKLEWELAQFKEKYSNIDLEQIEQLKQEKAQREEQELLSQKRYEELAAKLTEKNRAEVSAAQVKLQEYEQKLNSTLIEQAVTEAFLEAGGKRATGEGMGAKAFAKLLLPQIADRVKVIDGEIKVVDSNGEIHYNESTGRPMTLTELMGECRKGATAVLFDPLDKASGAGATANGRGRIGSNTRAELDKLPPAARIARARELGLI